LRWEDPAHPWQLVRAQIAAEAKEHRLVIAAPETAEAGQLGVARLIAEATVDGQHIQTCVDTQAAVRNQMPALTQVPGWLRGWLAFATSPAPGDALFELTGPADAGVFDMAARTSTLNLQVKRIHQEFTEAVSLEVVSLPAGCSATVESDKDSYRVIVRAAADLPAGHYPLRILAYGQMKERGHVVRQTLSFSIPPA
jgi:hypothetical protein